MFILVENKVLGNYKDKLYLIKKILLFSKHKIEVKINLGCIISKFEILFLIRKWGFGGEALENFAKYQILL